MQHISSIPLCTSLAISIRRLSVRAVAIVCCLFLQSPAAIAGPGAEAYNEFLEKGVIYPDEEWQDYVTEVGERLLSVSADAGKPYTFTVLDQPFVNAWATPDAYIFVTRGILAYFNSEDELAAVLGHEIGHVLGKHSKKAISQNRLGSLLGYLSAFATGSSSTIGLANTVNATSLAGYRRGYELEADEIGTELILRAGYNPRALLDSIQILRDHDDFKRSVENAPPIYHGLLGSHPAHAKRLHELVEQSQHLQVEHLAEPERDYLAMLEGLRFGDDSATGVVHEGVYYHGELRLKIGFPEGWDVGASAAEVFANDVPRQAKMSVRRSALPSEPQSAEQYLLETLRRDDLIDGEEIQVGPFAGYLASIETQGETPLLRKIAVLFKDGEVYVFDGEVKSGGDPVAFEQQFRDMLNSFRPMTADDLRLVNNQSLKLIEAKPGDRYSELAKTASISQHAEETLRVINGHHPRGEPRAGDRIKMIQ